MRPHRICIAGSAMALLAMLTSGAALPHEGAMGITAERMQVMKDMAAHMKALGAMLQGPAPFDPAQARDLAVTLHDSCHTAAGQFPAAGRDAHSRAAPAVWERPEAFEAEMEDLDVAVGALVTATSSGQRETIATRFASVGRACSSCHETFRLPDE